MHGPKDFMCEYHMCAGVYRSQRMAQIPRSWSLGCWELPKVGAGNTELRASGEAVCALNC